MLHIGYVICPANSSQFLSEEPLILLNVSVDIEDVHVPRILIFINIWENYRLLKLSHFGDSILCTSFVWLTPPTVLE
jgi:hypothetical protein